MLPPKLQKIWVIQKDYNIFTQNSRPNHPNPNHMQVIKLKLGLSLNAALISGEPLLCANTTSRLQAKEGSSPTTHTPHTGCKDTTAAPMSTTQRRKEREAGALAIVNLILLVIV